MTRAAACQHLRALNLVLVDQLRTFGFLMPLSVVALIPNQRRPLHREHFFLRPDELFRLAMTLETPLHLKRSNLIRQRHEVHPPMTGRASHTFVHMYAVIEIDEVGQVVNTSPLDRLAGAPAFTHRFKIRTICPDLRMTIHAGLSWRNAGIRKFLNRRVTITAINSIIADVMLVTELNGLFARKKRLSVVRGSIEFEQQPGDYPNEEHRAEDADLRNEVGASMKDLGHGQLSSQVANRHTPVATI